MKDIIKYKIFENYDENTPIENLLVDLARILNVDEVSFVAGLDVGK